MKISTIVRLACANSVGFSASTVMPLWLGGIAHQFDMPAWFASTAVLAQLGGAAVFNLLTPLLFRGVEPMRLARTGFIAAALAYFLMALPSSVLFIAACLLCGASFGVVLNAINRMMGAIEHVQRGYAIFVLIEICFAMTLFLTSTVLMARFGIATIFLCAGVSAVAAFVLIRRLPAPPMAEPGRAPAAAPRKNGYAILCLVSFAFFFVGQAALNAFMPTIGTAVGLSVPRAGEWIGLGMPCGFVGAMLARVIGERVRPVVPVTAVVAGLAALGPLLTFAPSFALFIGAIAILAASTILAVPYFFTQLSAFDHTGRYTAFGPAMMLTGIALGPGIAVMLSDRFGLPAVGLFSSLLLVVGGLCFALSGQALDASAATSTGASDAVPVGDGTG